MVNFSFFKIPFDLLDIVTLTVPIRFKFHESILDLVDDAVPAEQDDVKLVERIQYHFEHAPLLQDEFVRVHGTPGLLGECLLVREGQGLLECLELALGLAFATIFAPDEYPELRLEVEDAVDNLGIGLVDGGHGEVHAAELLLLQEEDNHGLVLGLQVDQFGREIDLDDEVFGLQQEQRMFLEHL